MLTLKFLLRRSASWIVSISSRSDFPIYSVDRKIRVFALRIFSYIQLAQLQLDILYAQTFNVS